VSSPGRPAAAGPRDPRRAATTITRRYYLAVIAASSALVQKLGFAGPSSVAPASVRNVVPGGVKDGRGAGSSGMSSPAALRTTGGPLGPRRGPSAGLWRVRSRSLRGRPRRRQATERAIFVRNAVPGGIPDEEPPTGPRDPTLCAGGRPAGRRAWRRGRVGDRAGPRAGHRAGRHPAAGGRRLGWRDE
jgi:hypothetical protein